MTNTKLFVQRIYNISTQLCYTILQIIGRTDQTLELYVVPYMRTIFMPELSKICANFKPHLFKISIDGKTRKRCSFTHIQVCTLEKEFRLHRYLTSEQRAKLASTLNLTEQQVSPKCNAPKIMMTFCNLFRLKYGTVRCLTWI